MTSTASFIPPEVVLGTTTSWLPLTTAYPSISGCESAFFLFPGQPAPVGWDPGYGYFAGGTLPCLPPEETTWWELTHQNPDGYTSLSIQPIVCPQAFTTAVTELRSGSSTYVMCCPSGYSVAGYEPGRVTGRCFSPLTSGQTISYTAQAANYSWISTTWSVTSATSIAAVEVRGWNVARSTSDTGNPSTTPKSTSTSTPYNVPQSSTGLSTGAKAGIGVAVALAILLALVLVYLLFRRARGRRQLPDHPYGTESSIVIPKEHSNVAEIHGERTRAELMHHPVELESPRGVMARYPQTETQELRQNPRSEGAPSLNSW